MGNAQQDPDKNTRKFFFDLNNFDEPDAPAIEENAPPPPPVFSLDELDAAKTLSHEQGKQIGINEERASREQRVAQLLQQISTQFATLFAAEQERISRYEEEAVMLTLQVLEKIFPAMNEKIGPYEAQQAIARVLKTATDQSEITIRIHPDYTGDIEAIVAPLRAKDINPPNFHIIGDASLGPGDCNLAWTDGGAVRDAEALASLIAGNLMALLPETALGAQNTAPDADMGGTKAENDDINEEVQAESSEGETAAQDSGEPHE